MHQATLTIGLFIVTFLYGIRHAIDWDHLAAITSISGTGATVRHRLTHSFLYVIGHASVIVVLGLLTVLIGNILPSWIDNIMEPFVGVTLVLLGSFLLYSILFHRSTFRMKSRWMLIFSLFHTIHHWLHHRTGDRAKNHHGEALEGKSSFLIGLIHGVGAETPTQLLLFLTLSGVSGKTAGALLVLAFVVGLLATHAIITLITSFGYTFIKQGSKAYLVLGFISAVFSLLVGVLLLSGHGFLLPSIAAG